MPDLKGKQVKILCSLKIKCQGVLELRQGQQQDEQASEEESLSGTVL